MKKITFYQLEKKNKIKSFLKNIENKLTIEFLKNRIALNEITNSLLKNVINTQNRLDEKLNKIMNKLDIVLE